MLALANAANLSADEEEAREVARVLAKPIEHFTIRNQQKNAAGFNVRRDMKLSEKGLEVAVTPAADPAALPEISG